MDGPTGSRRSAACAINQHSVCPHAVALQLNGQALCQCACHSGCPLAGLDKVLLQLWWNECRCPGSGRLRDEGRRKWPKGQPPNLSDVWRSVQEDNDVRSQARAAVAMRSAGRTRAQLRQMLIDELRSRGRDTPPEVLLDAEIDAIESTIPSNASTIAAFRTFAKSLLRARKAQREFDALARDAHILRGPHGEDPYLILPDYSLSPVTVILDPGSAPHLSQMGHDVFVSLYRDRGRDDNPVVVYADGNRIGVLDMHDGLRYQPALDAAQRVGRALMVQAILIAGRDSSLRLQIYPAGIL